MTGSPLFTAVSEAAPADAPALAWAEGSWTVGQLLTEAQRLAGDLERECPAGEPVVALVADIISTALLTLAADITGIPVIHADPGSPRPPGGLLVRTLEAADGVDGPGTGSRPLAAGLRAEATPGALRLAGVPAGAQIFRTSGSTGEPVHVVRSARAVLVDARRVAGVLAYRPGEAIIVSAPVFHAYGFNYGLLGALLAGAPVYYYGPQSIPSQLARAARRERAGVLVAHPAQYRMIAADAGASSSPEFDTLRIAVSAGAPLAPGVAPAIVNHHGFALYNCYGSSEAGAVTLTQLSGTEALGDAGELLPGVTGRITPANDSGHGELLLRTESLASGYLYEAGLVPLVAPDGWFATGDRADLTGGRLRLHGRIASIINVAGKKVHPVEIERVLTQHPAVVEAHVSGEADDVRGQVPVARVTIRAPLLVADLLEWCRGYLAPHQLPRRIEIWEALPRTATGKPVWTADPGLRP